MAIVRRRIPDLDEKLARHLAEAMKDLRSLDLFKPPGVAETLDWARALQILGADELTDEVTEDTLGVVLKYREDVETVKAHRAASL